LIQKKAVADFKAARFATGHPEISFKKGDVFRMLGADTAAGWAQGDINGQVGWFPLSYVTVLTDALPDNGVVKTIGRNELSTLLAKEKALEEQRMNLKKKIEVITTEKREIKKEITTLESDLKNLQESKPSKQNPKSKVPEKKKNNIKISAKVTTTGKNGKEENLTQSKGKSTNSKSSKIVTTTKTKKTEAIRKSNKEPSKKSVIKGIGKLVSLIILMK